jgi:DNA polymerase III sliding clamp (beta) subunit (PCNA family)
MKINKKYKIESASSTDASRYILNSVLVEKTSVTKDGRQAQAIATDGRIMAIVPAQLEDGDKEEAIVSPKAFATARKACGKLVDARIELSESARVASVDGEQSFGYIEGNYPNWKQVLPGDYKKSLRVSLDAKLLFNLWKAIGGEAASNNQINLEIDMQSDFNPIKVTTEGDGLGIIMRISTK